MVRMLRCKVQLKTIPWVLLSVRLGHIFSWVWQSAVILSSSSGAFNLSS